MAGGVAPRLGERAVALALGVGLGAIVGAVQGPGGQQISYAAYIAPALLAASAMNCLNWRGFTLPPTGDPVWLRPQPLGTSSISPT